jgi:hypothetical protein
MVQSSDFAQPDEGIGGRVQAVDSGVHQSGNHNRVQTPRFMRESDFQYSFAGDKDQIDEEEVETSAFGILYSISLLSFLQGRPAGASLIDYQEQDVWSLEDFHRHLSFMHGTLRCEADYVRG